MKYTPEVSNFSSPYIFKSNISYDFLVFPPDISLSLSLSNTHCLSSLYLSLSLPSSHLLHLCHRISDYFPVSLLCISSVFVIFLSHLKSVSSSLSSLSLHYYSLAVILSLLLLLFLCPVRPLGHHRMCKPKESLFLRTDSIITSSIRRISSVFFPGHQ
jgi:hypothetical protein